jgi:hypothetical protein
LRPGAAGAEEGAGADEGLLDFAARDAAVVVFWRLGAAWEGFWEGLGRFILGRGIVVRGGKVRAVYVRSLLVDQRAGNFWKQVGGSASRGESPRARVKLPCTSGERIHK